MPTWYIDEPTTSDTGSNPVSPTNRNSLIDRSDVKHFPATTSASRPWAAATTPDGGGGGGRVDIGSSFRSGVVSSRDGRERRPHRSIAARTPPTPRADAPASRRSGKDRARSRLRRRRGRPAAGSGRAGPAARTPRPRGGS